jgi:hypothetical protein
MAAAPRPAAPQLYCPAGLAARTTPRRALAAAAIVALVLTAVAVATPWGVRGALVGFAGTWALWMALMPVAVIASAVRNRRP